MKANSTDEMPSPRVDVNDQRPAVLITSNFSNRTGFAWTAFFRVFNQIARAADERGIDVVLSFAQIEGAVEVLDPDIPFESFVFDPGRRSWRGLLELRRRIRRHRIRYVYLTDASFRDWLYPLMRLWGVHAIVTHNHVSVASPYPADPERGFRRLAKTLLSSSAALTSDGILACSEFVKDRLVGVGCCPEERIKVLNYGLPETRFLDPTRTDASAENRPVRVFCAGRAARVKGVEHLIEATRLLMLREGVPDFEVSFAGAGPDLQDFQAQARDSGADARFRFLGFLEDTTGHVHAADVVVIPSVWGDAFPYSVLEAMAAGKAVVASRAGGIPEQIGDPSCGMLVPPADASALADALEELIKDPEKRRQLGINAHRRARECFREIEYFETVLSHVFGAFGLVGPGESS